MKLKLLLFVLLFSYSATIFSQTAVKLSTGQFGFNEGPVWDRSDKIYFSDVGTRKVEIYTVTNNTFSTAFTSTVRTNGLMFDENLNLVICEFQGGNASQRNTSGSILETLATGFSNPNDLCIDKKGGIYISSPSGFGNPSAYTNEIYYISPGPTRTKTLIDSSITFPNGVLISNDGKSLYVSDSVGYTIYKFDIDLDTGLINNRVNFATLTDTDNTEANSLADGMALDTNGNLYVAAKKSIQVFNTTGTLTNTINFTENPTNCTFGGSSLSTLYITTPNDLYKIDFTGVTGFQHPFDLPESNLSVDDLEKLSFKIFPNPTSNHKLNIAVRNINIDDISLYNSIGQKVGTYESTRINNTISIDLNPKLKSNIYILTIITSEGSTLSKKVIIE